MVSAAPARETEGDERTRRLWLMVRRALLMICAAIEREFNAKG